MTDGEPLLVDTPRGPARLSLAVPDGPPDAVLVLGHGAGGSIDAGELRALATHGPRHGLAVVRVEQPYRVAGRRSPAPAAHLDEAWVAAVAAARAAVGGEHPVVCGGRSSGARVAARTSAQTGAVGVLALAFPTVDPRGRSREPELDAVPVPVLVVQGGRDHFGVPSDAPNRTVHVIPTADHALRGVATEVVAVTLAWIADLLASRSRSPRPPRR